MPLTSGRPYGSESIRTQLFKVLSWNVQPQAKAVMTVKCLICKPWSHGTTTIALSCCPIRTTRAQQHRPPSEALSQKNNQAQKWTGMSPPKSKTGKRAGIAITLHQCVLTHCSPAEPAFATNAFPSPNNIGPVCSTCTQSFRTPGQLTQVPALQYADHDANQLTPERTSIAHTTAALAARSAIKRSV